MVYQAICGSRTYGINTESSDYDIVSIYSSNSDYFDSIHNESKVDLPKGCHRHEIVLTKDRFIESIRFMINRPYCIQYLYPEKFTCDTELVRYILENRDSFIFSIRSSMYNVLEIIFSDKKTNSDTYYNIGLRKSIVMSIVYMSMLYRYYKGESFISSKVPDDQLKSLLLNARLGNVKYEEIRKVYDSYLDKMKESESFYKSESVEDILNVSRFIKDCDSIIPSQSNYNINKL